MSIKTGRALKRSESLFRLVFLKNTYVGCKFQVIDFLLLEN